MCLLRAQLQDWKPGFGRINKMAAPFYRLTNRSVKTVLVCGLWSALQSGVLAEASEWAQWRGPDGDGIYKGSDWNAQFDKPSILWRTDIGTGFSSLAVAEGVVCATGHEGGQDSVFCLDAVTGNKQWSRKYPAELVDNFHEGGPAATPAIYKGKVYTISKDGQLFCFSLNEGGKVLWRKDVKKAFGTKMPEWGFSGSPLIKYDRLYLDAGATAAMNPESGKIIWKTKAYKPGYSTPAFFEQAGKRYMAVLNSDGLFVLNSDSGEVVARTPWKTQYDTNATTPIYKDGKIFVSTAYNKGCGLFGFDGKRLKPIYQNRNMRNHMNTSALWKGHLFGIDRMERHGRLVKLVCMDHATGEVVWSQGGFGCGSVLAAGGNLVILSSSGELVTAQASRSGYQEIARGQILTGRCWTLPVLSDGLLYARNAKGRLVCVDLRN